MGGCGVSGGDGNSQLIARCWVEQKTQRRKQINGAEEQEADSQQRRQRAHIADSKDWEDRKGQREGAEKEERECVLSASLSNRAQTAVTD